MEVEHDECRLAGATSGRDGRRTAEKAQRARPHGARADRACADRWRWIGAGHFGGPIALGTEDRITLFARRRGQVVRRQTANLLFVSSILTGASL
jgi:hypothetical protein